MPLASKGEALPVQELVAVVQEVAVKEDAKRLPEDAEAEPEE
jgi:hypothetical protein